MEETENPNSVTIHSGSSVKSAMSYESYRSAVGEFTNASHLTNEMARLNAAFGSPKDRSPAQVRLMAGEWFRALGDFGEKTVTRAFTKAIQTCKWWPSLAEIVALSVAERDEFRDIYGLKHQFGLKPFSERQEPTLTAQQVAERVAKCLQFRQEYGFTEGDIPMDTVTEIKPASQETWISPQMKNSCAVRRMNKLPTCSESCVRQNCNLRRGEMQ